MRQHYAVRQLSPSIMALLIGIVMTVTGGGAGAVDLDLAAPSAGLMQDPDVSATHIAFRWADDLWLVPRKEGVAVPLVSPPGSELRPRFSPDGQSIAFVASYDGDIDLYTMPVAGGVPVRVTHQPSWQLLSDWTPDSRLLYSAEGSFGVVGRSELYTVPATGGMPERVPVPYGSEAAVSSDGRWLAYIPMDPRWSQGWKRYVGGSATDIWMIDLETPGRSGTCGTARGSRPTGATCSMPVTGDRLQWLSQSARIGGEGMELTEGEAVVIPAGTSHEFWNDGEAVAEMIIVMFGEGA